MGQSREIPCTDKSLQRLHGKAASKSSSRSSVSHSSQLPCLRVSPITSTGSGQKPQERSGGKPQPASFTALPPDLPLALRHQDSTRNLRLPLVPLGFLTCLIHLREREFVGDKRVEGELVAVPYQIV